MTEELPEMRLLTFLDEHGLITDVQKRLLVTGLGNNEDLAKLAAAQTFHRKPVLDYVLGLPAKPLSVDMAIAWIQVGQRAANALVKHGGDVLVWAAALSDLHTALPGIMAVDVFNDQHHVFSKLLETVAPLGFTPGQLITKGRELLEQGVPVSYLFAALRAENPVPVSVLRARTHPLADLQHFREGKTDLPLESMYTLLAHNLSVVDYRNYRTGGVDSVEEMLSWNSAGVTGALAAKLTSDGEPKEGWRELTARLEPFGNRFMTYYRGALPVRTMADLLDEGETPETVELWDSRISANTWSIRKEVGVEGWLKLMRARCTAAFMHQFNILLQGHEGKFVVEEDGLLDGLLRLQEAGVNPEWARRYKVEVKGRRQLLPSDYIEGWQKERDTVRGGWLNEPTFS